VVREGRDGSRHIQLNAHRVDGMAEVTVRDSGPGLSAATAERLFEPFFTTKPKGMGMGLAISRSIVEAHRGRIWAERPDKRGSGTTLRFTLPLQPPKPARRTRRRT
jgi:signal transduction histidine kinase